MECAKCKNDFSPTTANNKYCSPGCRLDRSSRICIKCGSSIATSAIVDGKRIYLCKRLRCLGCQPWRDKVVLTPIQRKEKERVRSHTRYQTYKHIYAQKYTKSNSKRISELNAIRKSTLIKLVGGGCQICGYHKAMRNIAFHHVNASEKKFAISGNCFSHSVTKLSDELAKCICICHNCHGEVHEGLVQDLNIIELNLVFQKAVAIWVDECKKYVYSSK